MSALVDDEPPYVPSFFKRATRICIAAACFSLPLGCGAPFSPIIKLMINKENFNKMAPKIASNFVVLTGITTAITYGASIEWGLTNRAALGGYLPYITPFKGIGISLASLLVCHSWFPGYMALIQEPPATKMRQFLKMNLKCFVAFAPIHFPYFAGVGLVLGFVFWPFTIYKDRSEAGRIQSTRPPEILLPPFIGAEGK